ncbi:S8 family serine peptidase [Deinococcus sp. KNUC1210]|uniref:S8 family serine peptidase n=1 Tax=Deinococcus sp. KNUC1210 TaxID=2917691 RepID=UPI001EF12924|nr:S8 family serine peptidase [Deinococcus sp. KNUC1210]ULH15578.1 S8 family serine peptidase [Deinococcus sp. KNUC1210]
MNPRRVRSCLLIGLSLTLAACAQSTTSSPAVPLAAATDSSIQTDPVESGAYLIGFRQSPTTIGTQSLGVLSVSAQALTVQAAGGTVKTQFVDIAALAAHLTPAAVAALKADPNVEYVEPDYRKHALDLAPTPAAAGVQSQAISTQAVLGTASGETTWGDAALRVPALRAAGYTGAGVAVCITDTGIDGNQPEFTGRLRGYRNFTAEIGRDSAYSLNDVHQHGTHVAGTVAAQYGIGSTHLGSGMNVNGVGGVASGVNLYMARVLDDNGNGFTSDIINGVNWCTAQLKSKGGTENHVVISMSLSGGSFSTTEQRAYTAAYNAGAMIVAASGNWGTTVSYPAAYTNVLAVGAVDVNSQIAVFSNPGSKVALVGPGVNILSTRPLGQGTYMKASATGLPAFSDISSTDPLTTGNVSGTIVAAGGTNNEFCGTGVRNPALNGNIALISRGNCNYEEKISNAYGSGAIAVMIYNTTTTHDAPGTMALNTSYPIPAVGLSKNDGLALRAKLPTTGTVSINSGTDYDFDNGTSMATPHVSAAAAVVWAAKPTLTPTQLTSLLTSTATDLGPAGKDNSYGYGLVNPYKAITGN